MQNQQKNPAQNEQTIHFKDHSICYGVPEETLCGLTYSFLVAKTQDLMFVAEKSIPGVTCGYCRSILRQQGKLPPNRIAFL